ncbi:hypothetical protein CEXT_103181 [Caerostris extrusa]|uniref:Uncharacterized protein n=1 Tax=Caerostris extrusa TaxID=172846 RepID=A0AAV4X5Y8_CAEEX|nr:hypothetical protein CEXT_103181 [Caerostris extrusa]
MRLRFLLSSSSSRTTVNTDVDRSQRVAKAISTGMGPSFVCTKLHVWGSLHFYIFPNLEYAKSPDWVSKNTQSLQFPQTLVEIDSFHSKLNKTGIAAAVVAGDL